MNILLADDDSTSRDLMRRVIGLAPGHTLTEVTDGNEAWSALNDSTRAFDLALLDVTMPGLDGIDVLERVRADPRLHELPVILCTAMHDRETVQRALKLSVSHYIVKPYTREFVLEKLRLIEAARLTNIAEAPAAVAQRLGLTTDDVTQLSTKLITDIRALLEKAGQVLPPAQFKALAVAANGLKGASFNLGLRRLGRELDRLEQVYLDDFSAPHRVQFPLTASEVTRALDSLKVELGQVEAIRLSPS